MRSSCCPSGRYNPRASLSVVIDASVTSSASHRRPRATAATSVARVSERIGRTFCGGIPSGGKNLTASGRWCPSPGDTKSAIGKGLLTIGCCVRFADEADDQLLRLNLNTRDSGGNEASVVNTLGRFEDCALDEGRGQIVSVFDIALAGVAWGHAVAAIIVERPVREPRISSIWPYGW